MKSPFFQNQESSPMNTHPTRRTCLIGLACATVQSLLALRPLPAWAQTERAVKFVLPNATG